MPRLGVVGSLVWDEIHGREAREGAVHEWGGIAYALASFDAELAEPWEIVPLIKVGQDLAPEASRFLATLQHLAPGTRCAEVTTPNNRVVLRYQSAERRLERMSGGVPAWTWAELGPMIQDLDALYLNFISGFELALGTAQALRQAFGGFIYADLHSLLLGLRRDGCRVPRPLPDAPSWFGCFDIIQVNEEEMNQLGPDPLSLASEMLGAGVSALVVTLGSRGAVYVTDQPFARGGGALRGGRTVAGLPTVTALVPAARVDEPLDPTGCGDVFGAAACAHLLAGESLEAAILAGNRSAARNVAFRGASGLSHHLRGRLVTP